MEDYLEFGFAISMMSWVFFSWVSPIITAMNVIREYRLRCNGHETITPGFWRCAPMVFLTRLRISLGVREIHDNIVKLLAWWPLSLTEGLLIDALYIVYMSVLLITCVPWICSLANLLQWRWMSLFTFANNKKWRFLLDANDEFSFEIFDPLLYYEAWLYGAAYRLKSIIWAIPREVRQKHNHIAASHCSIDRVALGTDGYGEVVLECGHRFHCECLRQWERVQFRALRGDTTVWFLQEMPKCNRCPVCRTRYDWKRKWHYVADVVEDVGNGPEAGAASWQKEKRALVADNERLKLKNVEQKLKNERLDSLLMYSLTLTDAQKELVKSKQTVVDLQLKEIASLKTELKKAQKAQKAHKHQKHWKHRQK